MTFTQAALITQLVLWRAWLVTLHSSWQLL